ncbi:A/G-specific adenine glycosylase [Dyadobacter sp. CY261]|uniref:A/G-specific adenine glycosylase n=1 Tax=Dyadobacter sp. CY261 TaxID=2907203 RepID=UPI001F2BAD0C|nr:A/G-specific adenine glycosylase [Dyadobacter sp. CY261]MCF0071965.1 A/G-specific adenine glycosylase [Dyadobacter sp. CY261]
MHISENNLIPDDFEVIDFNRRLKSWYLENHRPLPWRETKDPYKIWLSEVILQQTRVVQGLPYYERFIDQYPTVHDLAAADERDVLRLWQGLGYYSRARNMHFTARQVVNEYKGEFPETSEKLSKLKGLGQYTAAAIASFAFDEVVPAIDGNVYRVMSRIFGIQSDMLSSEGKKEFSRLARQTVSREDPATYNQAMIEFGALQCVPASPNCAVCIFNDRCFAFAHQMQGQLPVKIKKLTVKQRFMNYYVVRQGDRLAMQERRGRDIWTGLYDFYLIESKLFATTPDELTITDSIFRNLLTKGRLSEVPKLYSHILTHQRLQVRFWWLEIPETERIDLPPGLAFYDHEEVEALPKPILIDTFLREEDYL